ncbi:RING finger protein 112 isoform X1 [Zootoca vivipara]|uniref:RING finger protein 112 isoform X1 n=1 Tax=Zootoca vivipara TaxID=8524 RepID=UPI00293BDABA|nr:RING finger protein 112 isoform X1 [Zootoca vivipara]XP_034991540.2 RING finger protein 112 isoform X1 [Zootoca vivipara]XP_034991543.2 RING finger protein 112 isoform X1 [Zootoca vivipara]XP_060137545.1 RING finger protein 112 isoform X1 [Zootoca vivipara]
MGNTNTKPLSSLASPTKTSAGGMIQDLKEDITCSICLDPFEDPVSIDCGHNFCRVCLSAHWSGFSRHGYRCPECRHPCSRERMIPDTRLRSLVEKIGQLPVKEVVEEVVEEELEILEPGGPVQLVGLDDDGELCLDEEALSHCLEQRQVKDAPVCLVSILGEQRRGKSFLLNFLLRRLQNLHHHPCWQEAEDESWMGQQDEALTGFEWRPGPNTTTKGVWIWSRPFWVQSEHGKIAMFLVDTEGSMDVERKVEDGVKLSAFSMLLSSYQILNLATMMKDPDLEYLDMFMYVAETVGRSCRLKAFQHLDVLVRDWFFPPVFGFQEGQNYLQSTIQRLDPKRHPRALEALRSTSTRCYLMPFPGRRLVVGTEGTLADMDEDFRDCLKVYGNDIARSAAMHVKSDQEGRALTGAQLAAKVKNFSSLMKKYKFGFSSVTQMAITLHNLDIQERLKQEFEKFIRNQDELSRPMIAGLQVTPKSMTRRLLDKQSELMCQCKESLQGDEPGRTESILSLENHLKHEAQIFTERYHRRYKSHALKAGVAIGMGAVGLAGGAIGAGVAAAVVAAEAIVLSTGTAATFAIGTMAGAGTFAVIGGGVGAGVGSSIGERRTQEARNVTEDDPEGEEETSLSDERCLIGQRNSP